MSTDKSDDRADEIEVAAEPGDATPEPTPGPPAEPSAENPAPRPELDPELPREERVTALVRRWLARSAALPVDPAAERLAGVLRDPNGLAFTVGFLDGVVRPEDLSVAAADLSALTPIAPAVLPPILRGAIATGGALGPLLPWVVVPAARRVLRQLLGHLVVDASPSKLGPAIGRRSASGDSLDLHLLGEAVLGERAADRRLESITALLSRPDVDHVSLSVPSITGPLSMWAFDDAVNRAVARLTPLYELAAAAPTPAVITLEPEEYEHLDLTLAVFRRVLDQPLLRGLEAAIVLPTTVPDTLGALQELTAWAEERRLAGGAPITVRLRASSDLAMDRVDAVLHDWPLASFGERLDIDTNHRRVLDWALTAERTRAVRIGVAGDPFDLAHAWLLATDRGVADRVAFELPLGLATGRAQAIREDVGPLLFRAPVVNPGEFDAAAAHLIRRLEESAGSGSALSTVLDPASDDELVERERMRFAASLEALRVEKARAGGEVVVPAPLRDQDRIREWSKSSGRKLVQAHAGTAERPVDPASAGLTQAVLGLSRGSSGRGAVVGGRPTPFDVGGRDQPDANAKAAAKAAAEAAASLDRSFHNEPDTDPSIAANRTWARRILARVPGSTLGEKTLESAVVTDDARLERIIGRVITRAERWGGRLGYDRAAIIDRAGLTIAANRDRLIEVSAAETGETLAEADSDVSAAVDFAHYYAGRARELDSIQGARFVPAKLTVVAPPWNAPVSIPAGSVLAALAAGSGVILTPAPQARRSAAVLVEALWDAGIPQDLLALVDLEEGELGQRLIADPRVDRVLLTGTYETAKLFRSWRHDLPLLAETSGKNAIIVTPSADYDLAVADIVDSAFGNAGQKSSAASLVILVGSVGRSKRFRNQLIDATTSLRVGPPEDPASTMGPLVGPATGKLLHALTTLGAEERWLVEPRQLDDSGRLWTPGIREGVQPESYFHLTEFFGPVLGIMHAATLEEAVELQNATDYGLTAGLHSLDGDELATWLDRVEAGNLFVNRRLTGSIVRRQPYGGWKRSAVGAGTKAGGPNHLIGLGDWEPLPAPPSTTLHLRGLDDRARHFIESAQASLTFEQFDLLRRAALSDQLAWGTEFGIVKDAAELGVERNLLRYRRVPVAIRLADGGDLGELLRVVAAGLLTRARLQISTPVALPPGVQQLLRGDELSMLAGLIPTAVVETDAEWLRRLATGEIRTSRLRIVGGERPVAAADVDAANRAAAERAAEEAALAAAAEAAGTAVPVRGAVPVAPEPDALSVLLGTAPAPAAAVVADADDAADDADDAADEVNSTRSFTDVVEGIQRGSLPTPVPLVRADGSRISLAEAVAEVLRGDPDIAVYAHPVTSAGRIELLPFLREQAISITAHRRGAPSALSEDVI